MTLMEYHPLANMIEVANDLSLSYSKGKLCLMDPTKSGESFKGARSSADVTLENIILVRRVGSVART